MKHIGLDVEPIYQKITESPEQGVHFVKTAIDQGHPIGMLILTHEAQILEEETWIWWREIIFTFFFLKGWVGCFSIIYKII